MLKYRVLKIFTDGGARGNPGPAGIGAVLKNEADELLVEISEYIGETTNNQAEYKALLAALERASLLNAEEVHCYLDSELVVKQARREYKVKHPDLAPLFLQLHNLSCRFRKITFTHVRRELNKEADALVNLALDKQMSVRMS